LTDIQVGLVTAGNIDRAAELEELPIDSLWTAGHVAAPNPTPEALTSLAQLSAVTSRVQLGTAILLLPLYAPAIVAKQVAEIDRASGGRVVLGVGIGGEYPAEFSACGVPLGERGPRTDEAIGVLRQLWTGEEITHDGRFYGMESVRIHPPPAQPGGPPIVVGGRKEPAMRRAALLGDGWMPYLYSPRRYAASVTTIREVADKAGRDLATFGWYAFVFVNIDSDGDHAREKVARFLGGTYRQDFKAMVDSVAAAGTSEEVTAKLSAFVEAGARHFIFVPAEPDDARREQLVHRLVDDVMPAVRA
jgi:probable F420-dependent oxidoreductase